MEDTAPRIAVITGPTATGKSELGVILAEELNGEVVSADSMQVYRGFDIGTAKITKQEQRGIAHHMLSVAEPDESYSVARYVEQADGCVRDILSRGRLPILVGGTGLYIDSLISGRVFAGERDEGLRQELSDRYDSLGGESLLRELKQADPERAAKLHPSDKKRIIRALEVFRLTGVTQTEHDQQTQKKPPLYDARTLALNFSERQTLYRRIDTRVDRMLSLGLVSEVKGLLDAGVSPVSTSMQAIGYKELASYLQGEISLDEAVETVKRESRRYAKRQLTWLGKKKVNWILWSTEPNFSIVRRTSAEFLQGRGLE
jgi:tRNA dimethylallyltransferase